MRKLLRKKPPPPEPWPNPPASARPERAEALKVSILEKDAFDGKDVVVKVSKALHPSETERLSCLLKETFPGASHILVLDSQVDIELPREGTVCEAVPLESFLVKRRWIMPMYSRCHINRYDSFGGKVLWKYWPVLGTMDVVDYEDDTLTALQDEIAVLRAQR